MDKRRIKREYIESKEWGPDFLREMDLVIASNVLESLTSYRTLYERTLAHQVAELCMPLDGELNEVRLPTIIVPEGDTPDWQRADEAVATLKDFPRGHWAVVELNGTYDAFMADGFGGIGTEPGAKFDKISASSPRFNPVTLYAAVISYMVYDRRNKIANEIMDCSFREADIKPGQVFKDMRFNGRQWSNVEFVGIKSGYYVGGTDAVEIRATRRGVKATSFIMPTYQFAANVGVTPVMPAEYDDVDNRSRLIEAFQEHVTSSSERTVILVRP